MSNSTIRAGLPPISDYEKYQFDYNEYAGNFWNTSLENASIYLDNGYQYEFDLWEHYLKPETKEWLVLVCYLIVFILSLVGNGLIVTYVLRRKNLQTTVNCYMLNLALADTLVTIIALPSTVAVDIFETWPFGRAMCKFVPYLQMTVTSVSSLSLGAIAINRWYVVCHPLKVSKTQNARKSALIGMAVIWMFSFATLCPVAVVTQLHNDFETVKELESVKSCAEVWESHQKQAAFHVYYFGMCYLCPLIVLAATYTMVFRRLRKAEIPGHCTTVRYRRECHCDNTRKSQIYLGPTSPTSIKKSPPASPTSPSCARQEQKTFWRQHGDQLESNKTPFPCMNAEENQPLNTNLEEKMQPKIRFTRKIRKSLSLLSFKKSTKGGSCKKCSAMTLLLRSRRRSATMQVVLIAVFGVCYAPVMILDLLRQVFSCSFGGVRETKYFGFAVAHLIVYVNSAINPIIYNFFSSQFRKEFRKTFSCFFKHDLKRRISGFSSSFILSKWDQQTRRETLQTTPRMSEC